METTEMLEAPVVESGGESEQQGEQQHPDVNAQRQADKDYANYIKGLREDDAKNGKFARRVKDDYSRLQALTKIDPKGIDSIRSRYETLNGVAHGDKTGIDAVQSIQEALAESQSTLDAIAQGDIKSLGDDQLDGVLKMAPSVLDHLADTNPDAYSELLLPHLRDGLKASPLYSSFNGLLHALNQKPPSWLPKEKLPEWTLDHVQTISTHAQKMDQWFKALDDRVEKGSSRQATIETGATKEPVAKSGVANPDWWKQNAHQQTSEHVSDSFSKELRPWAEKLAKAGIRLSDAKKQAYVQEYYEGVAAQAAKNGDYVKQMNRFNGQRNPDAASVLSTFRREFNTHSKNVLESLIRRDYGQVLDKRTSVKPPVQQNGNGGKPPIAPQAGVKFVSVKPDRSQINFQKTPVDWLYQDKWILKNGETVQFRA